MIEGGFVKGSSVLVSGTPGSGKTTLGMQFLIDGAKKSQEPGIFISFEENLEMIRENFLRFGWRIEDLELEGKLVLAQKDSTLVGSLLKNEFSELQEFMDRIGAARVVIDSVNVMTQTSSKITRRSLVDLIGYLRGKGCTTLVIHERTSETVDSIQYEPLDFLFDGILFLSSFRMASSFRQILRIPKMRYTKVMQKIVPLQISGKGVSVHPEMSVFE